MRVTRGLYRQKDPAYRLAWAHVSDGDTGFDVPEPIYRKRGYEPPFESLPTKDEYGANAKGSRRAKRKPPADRPKG